MSTETMDTNVTFAELLGQHLYELERSASWLAKQLNVDPSTIAKWLNEGVRPKSIDVVVAIADALDIYEEEKRRKLFTAAGYTYQASNNSEPINICRNILLSIASDLNTTEKRRILANLYKINRWRSTSHVSTDPIHVFYDTLNALDTNLDNQTVPMLWPVMEFLVARIEELERNQATLEKKIAKLEQKLNNSNTYSEKERKNRLLQLRKELEEQIAIIDKQI